MKAMDFLMWSADGGERSQYVRDVTDLIIERLEVPNGDAQGIIECQGSVVINAFLEGESPEVCYNRVLDAATVS